MINKGLPEMPYRELVELITDYLEARLSPVDRDRFEAHLAECGPCRTYLDQFRQTILRLGDSPPAAAADHSISGNAIHVPALMHGSRE